MWNKDQIRALKQTAYSFISDDYVREHLSALNIRLSSYDRQPLVTDKNRLWREAEHEADLIREKLDSMQTGNGALN